MGSSEANLFYQQLTERNTGVYSLDEQTQLRNSRVAIVGLGGVGGYAAVLCARLGIGYMTGIDADHFELSNFNRQLLATLDTLGKSKARSTEAFIRSINPHLTTHFIAEALTADNAETYLANHDVILSALDDMPSRVLLHRAAKRLGTPCITMSGSPPHRAFIASFYPQGIDYETALNLPSKHQNIQNPAVRAQVLAVKQQRAQHSVKHGATSSWAEAYCANQAGWSITAVRASLIATFCTHEISQVALGKEPLARAPKALIINLDNPQPVTVCEPDTELWQAAHF